ncbi:hypothetical protein [Microbispora sp. NPDC049633]|uniref:hypothetical protein n=1 Tax=Microbispora sp. NPDC049633 TaxID=3154355 RepID=UPI00341B00FF
MDRYDHHESLADAALQGYALGAIVDAANNPQWQQVIDPRTGQPVYHADGTPMLDRVPLYQQVAPRVYRAVWIKRLAVVGFVVWTFVLFFGSALIQKALGPDNWQAANAVAAITSGVFYLSIFFALLALFVRWLNRRQ